MKIIIFGHVCIDKNVIEDSSYTTAGGPPIFISRVFRQLPDSQVVVAAPHGPDFLKYYCEMCLYPPLPNKKQTLIYRNIVKNNKRIQKAYRRNIASPIEINDKLGKLTRQADVVFVTPLLPNFSYSYLKRINSFIQKKSLKILLPQGYFRKFNQKNVVVLRDFKEAVRILMFVDVVIVSDEDHPEIKKLAQRWVSRTEATVIITMGNKGALLVTKKRKKLITTIPVPAKKIVNSIGLGDAFGAGFAYHYLRRRNLEEAVDFANKLARRCLFYPPDKIKINYQALLSG